MKKQANTGENIIEKYFTELWEDDAKPAVILCRLYYHLFRVSTDKEDLAMFNKLVKGYGRTTVFFALLDLSGRDVLENPYAQLNATCKNRFYRQHVFIEDMEILNLDEKIKTVTEQIATQKTTDLEIRELFDD